MIMVQVAALLAVLAVVLPAEFAHWREVLGTPDSFGINVDTTLPLLLIVLLPYFWFVRRPFWSPSGANWQRLKVWWLAGVDSRCRLEWCSWRSSHGVRSTATRRAGRR